MDFHASHTASVIGMFLRDMGQYTCLDESKLELTLSQFTMLLLQIGNFKLNNKKSSPIWTLTGLRAYWESSPPTQCCDVVSRWGFPLLLLFQLGLFYLFLDTWGRSEYL